MTPQAHPSVIGEVVHVLAEHGFDGMAQAMEQLFNECLKIERQQALGVGPYQRGEARRGQANGFKPKRLKTRVGPLNLSVPQVRGARFYPRSLERGSRSEKALRLALAEMYVQGVSTAKVTRITEELCGCEISSSDVSRATALLDETLAKWRSRPLGQKKYLVLDARYEKIRQSGCVVDCAVLVAIGVDCEAGTISIFTCDQTESCGPAAKSPSSPAIGSLSSRISRSSKASQVSIGIASATSRSSALRICMPGGGAIAASSTRSTTSSGFAAAN